MNLSTQDRILLIIFTLLLFQGFINITTQTTSDIDIVFRSLVSLIIGYFTSSAFMASVCTANPFKSRVIGVICVVACVMLIVVRNMMLPVTGDVFMLRDVVAGCVGCLMGKGKND